MGIDELAMMICREVGCDLSYCQHVTFKPKSSQQRVTDCTPQFNAFRECVVREKRMFRGLISDQDMQNPQTIPEYLDKHFKEKVKMKKQTKMMGGMENELREKIDEMEQVNTAGRKLVDVKEFQRRKAKLQENTYM